MPKISVIMPVYNTKEEYLREAIESFLNQTFTDFEFIIVNDGSTNNAEEVIRSYQDERIKYLKQENQGISKSRNNAYKYATGEYIAIFDSDDISLPQRFEKQVKFLDENENVGVLATWGEKFPEKVPMNNFPERPNYMDLLDYCCLLHPSVMIRKSVMDKHNISYDESLTSAVDYDLWRQLITCTDFYTLQETLVKYRWHNGNVSVKDRANQDKNAQIVHQKMLDMLTDNVELQHKIMNIVAKPLNYNFFERIFSIKNRKTFDKKQKILTILGVDIKIKDKKVAL